MSRPDGYTEELSLGEVVSRAFHIYKENFVKFFAVFLLVELITGEIGVFLGSLLVRPTTPISPTPQQALNYLFSTLTVTFELSGIILLVTILIDSLALGIVIRLASRIIEKGSTDLGSSIRFAFSRWVFIIIVSLLVGVIVWAGAIALFVPGIILGIMFSLAIPVIIIEPSGIMESLSRSRQLVSKRWLKTLGLILILSLIYLLLDIILLAFGGFFGTANWLLVAIISSLYAPMVPIALAVFYYSNVARLAPPPFPTQAAVFPSRFCRFCGAQIEGNIIFCPSCGSKQQAD